jgi:hypothetical protein
MVTETLDHHFARRRTYLVAAPADPVFPYHSAIACSSLVASTQLTRRPRLPTKPVLVGKLMITILGGLAEFERSLILARTSEGRTRAMARGVRFGRKPKLSRFQIEEAIARRSAGEALTEIGRTYGVSHSTISRL